MTEFIAFGDRAPCQGEEGFVSHYDVKAREGPCKGLAGGGGFYVEEGEKASHGKLSQSITAVVI